jgi:hypothetical protein
MTTTAESAISSWYGLIGAERIGGHGKPIILAVREMIPSQIVAFIAGVAIRLPSDCGQFAPKPLSK